MIDPDSLGLEAGGRRGYPEVFGVFITFFKKYFNTGNIAWVGKETDKQKKQCFQPFALTTFISKISAGQTGIRAMVSYHVRINLRKK